jgi:hypothetical protein
MTSAEFDDELGNRPSAPMWRIEAWCERRKDEQTQLIFPGGQVRKVAGHASLMATSRSTIARKGRSDSASSLRCSLAAW